MAEARTHRVADAASADTIPGLIRQYLRHRDPPLRRPRRPRIEPIHHSWLGLFWQARVSVRAGIGLDEFLRSRLARYLAALPVPRSRLPLAVDIEDGQIAVSAVEPEVPPVPPDADAWLAPLVAAEGPAIQRELGELEVRQSLLEGDIYASRKRTEEISHRLASDVALGLVAAPSTVEATSEQMGRPVVGGGAAHATVAFALAAAVAETWQIALPLLRSAGIDLAAIQDEIARTPAKITLVSVFALGISAALFSLAHAFLDATVALFHGEGDASRRRWLGAAAAGAAAFSTLVASAVASLPAGRDPVPSPWISVVLLLAVPLATALILRAGRRVREKHEQEIAAALEWDRERARTLGERARRLEELAWAREEESALERERDAARRRIREISARAALAARFTEEADLRERAALSHLAQSLVRALELDRYEFLRQAASNGATDLIAPRRRKAPDGRGVFAAATASASAAPAPEVQPGRLVS